MSLSRASGTSSLKESAYTIVLDIDDLMIPELDMSEQLIQFLKEEVGGLVIDNSIDQFQFIQSCKRELFRNETKEINAINANKKKELLNLIGSNLFHFIPVEKKKAIAAAFANEAIEEVHIKLVIPESLDESDFKTFLPWEYMRCTTAFLEKEKVPHPKNLWLAGEEKIVFYRSLQKQPLTLPVAEQIKVLIVDTTEEQQVYKIFNPENGKSIYEKLNVNPDRILFESLGKEEGKYATRSNFIDSVSSIKPQIIHFVGSYGINADKQAVFSFFDKVGSVEKEEYSFELGAKSDYFEDWFIYNRTTRDRPRFYILQEGSNPKNDSHESLDQLAHLMSSIGVLATCVIPHQSSYDFPLKSIYENISNLKSIGKSVLHLRKRYLRSECHSLPILYMNQGDFVLLKQKEQIYSNPTIVPTSEKNPSSGFEMGHGGTQHPGRDSYSTGKFQEDQFQHLSEDEKIMMHFNNVIKGLSFAINKIERTIGGQNEYWTYELEDRREKIFKNIQSNKLKYQELIPGYMDQLYQNDFDFESWMEENGLTW